MNKFDTSRIESLPERALALAGQARDGVWRVVPDGAGKWLQTGVAIGAVKKGSRVAGNFVRRNPAAVAAVATAAGVLWLLARRQARRAENGPAKGRSTRVDARRGNGRAGVARARAARTPSASRRQKSTTE